MSGGVFDLELVEEKSGLVVFRASGKCAEDLFKEEAGGHRWQRTPPTEKRGRVHTSTVTVAVLPEPPETQIVLQEKDLEWGTCRSSGSGGQIVNKRDTAVWIKHVPTGVMVRCESERSQHQNKETARSLLRARLWQAEKEKALGKREDDRRRQVGSGQRGDKTWSVDVPEDRVTHHASGRKWRFKDYQRGRYDW